MGKCTTKGQIRLSVVSQAAWYRMEKRAESRKWEKFGRKKKMALGPKWGEKWPKNGDKIKKWPQIPVFRHGSSAIF